MPGRRARFAGAAAIAALVVAGGPRASPARAEAVADFYKDKIVTLVSAGEAGGAHGTYAQLISAHIRKHIPGNPTVVIQYMLGAGGNQAANYLYNVAPKDGTAIGLPLQDLIFNARIGVQAVKYDAAKTHYLGGADVTRTTVSVMKASGVHSLDDARRNEVLMGATGKSGQTYIIPVVLNSMLATKFRVVTGYQGINFIHLAMERGELHGSAASWPTIAAAKKSWVEKGLINNLVTVAMEREPDLPAVPALAELVTAAEDKALIPLLAGSAALGRAWIAFGDIPHDRLAALRDAWVKTMADPAFRAEAAARGLSLNPVTWQAQQELTERILATPDATVGRLKGILGLD
jgi:tripartite-type tricarboxylate transporter receptor subunit TctC